MSSGTEKVLDAVAAAFPRGPTRKASTRGIAAEQLNPLALTIKDTSIFDGGDHWFYLFIGCAEINRPFELSLRITKASATKSPPAWPIPVVGTIANDIAYGRQCTPGTTWKLEGGLGDLLSPFCGVIALPDLQFGQLAPITVYQLVPITGAELLMQGDAKIELARRLSSSRARMLAQPESEDAHLFS